MKQMLMEKFIEIFGDDANAQLYFAPGRVNLIGEYTDITGGYVFPCALTLGTYAVARKRNDTKLRLYSMNFDELGVLDASITHIQYDEACGWTNYPKGILWTLQEKGYEVQSGLDVLYFGNIPNASGLSSSASIEVLTLYILNRLFALNIEPKEMALLAQYSENHFNRVNCGIMDQFAITMGKKDNAVFLNTSDLSFEYAPLQLNNMKIVILNTNKKRGLADSKYNERRAECDEALSDLQAIMDIHSLGELTEDQFEQHKSAIKNPICAKRAKHAVYENRRTQKAVQALKNHDIHLFGSLLAASHHSLRDDFEVSGIELDTLVEAAWKQDGVLGARMTGAGFGGCAVSIVETDCVPAFIKNVGEIYEQKIGYAADFYVVEVGGGPAVL